jgi:mono/diheme cytochrome c family protein
MKTMIKISKQLMGFFPALFLLALATQPANAQKPKGSPWPAPAAAISVKNPVKADAVSIKDGKELYIKNCKSCHGDAGKGDGTKAKNLDISCSDFSLAEFKKVSDGEVYWKMTEGRKPMPSFSKKLTDAERWSILNYIRTFAK